MAIIDDPDYAYFDSIPWTHALVHHPDYTPTSTLSRSRKSTTEDAVISETLNTKDTIRAYLALHKKPSAASSNQITELRTLLSLGYAVNDYPNLVHGGIIGLMIDEAMGLLLQLNANAGNGIGKGSTVTAWLKVEYLKPVATPSVVVVTARLREVKGRKIYIDAVIEGENRAVLAKGEALWVNAKESVAKL